MEDFDTCYPIQEYGGIWPQYYQMGSSYKGGLYAIKKIFREKFNPSNSQEFGYFTIRFVINCKGIVGKLEVLECTKDFQSTAFSLKMRNDLVNIFLGLKDWIPGKTRDGIPIDSQKYLTFKIEEGKLVDIVPK